LVFKTLSPAEGKAVGEAIQVFSGAMEKMEHLFDHVEKAMDILAKEEESSTTTTAAAPAAAVA
jgi:hypothetical protein